MSLTVDKIINASWVIPVETDNLTLKNHSVVIHQGKILDIVPTETAKQNYTTAENIDLYEHAIIPGLINAHTHAAMNLFRGLADDLPLMDWLNNHIWPAEQNFVNEEFVADGTNLAIAEMIKGGTTCFNDMYFNPDITAQIAEKSHIRASLGLIVIDFPSSWATNQDEYFDKGLHVYDQYKDHPLINLTFAPHAPYSVSDEPLKRIQTLVNELEIPIHMHIHETQHEIELGLESHAKRPIERLNELGLLTPSLIAVHMTQLTKDDISLIANAGCHVVHCPQSNLKLASGFCPISKLIDAGINVALGTDSAASNNNLNMFEEMKTAALLAKAITSDASSIPAYQALKMATLNGAKALGIDDITGSLTKGKSADITAIKLDNISTMPIYNPISQIVYASQANSVSNVWIEGKQVLKDHQLTLMNETEILHKAQAWGEKISANPSIL